MGSSTGSDEGRRHPISQECRCSAFRRRPTWPIWFGFSLLISAFILGSVDTTAATEVTVSTTESSARDGRSLRPRYSSPLPNRRGKPASKLASKLLLRISGTLHSPEVSSRCGPPPAIPNAKWNYFMSGTPLRARVQYHCFAGFLLEGDDTITCSDMGEWSDVPSCVSRLNVTGNLSLSRSAKIEPKSAVGSTKGCGTMPRVRNGFIKETSMVGQYSRVSDYVLFDCASGYSLVGSNRIECLTERQWSSRPPGCVADKPSNNPPLPTCGKALLLLSNAYAMWASYSIHQAAFPGDRVQYTCVPGFRMFGNSTITCLASGQWTSHPVCKALNVNCTIPKLPQNVTIINEGNGTLTLGCQEGYILIGRSTIVCRPNNTWSRMPSCSAGKDRTDNELLDAYPTEPHDDFELVEIHREEAAPVHCPQPPEVENSRQITSFENAAPIPDDFVTYQCFYRYYLDGPATLLCGTDGNWTPDPPSCKAVGVSSLSRATTPDFGCPEPQLLPNTKVVKYFDGIANPGDVFEYHCIEGYEPTSSSGRGVCSPNRRWAIDPNFACIVTSWTVATTDAPFSPPSVQQQPFCPAAQEIQNGRMAVFYLGRARPGDIVEYRCLDGYRLEGTSRITCGEDYKWTTAPACVAREVASGCSQVPSIDNGYVTNDGIDEKSTFKAGDFVSFECLVGFQLVGNKNSYCLTSGRWTTQPRCAPAVFESHDDNGFHADTEEATTRAQEASTDPSTTCPDLASPPYAIRELTSYWMAARPGDFVRFRCLPGYILLGNSRVVCQPDGDWSLSPSCLPVGGSTESIPTRVFTTTPPTSVADQFCPNPPSVPNAVSMSSYRTGSRARPGDYIDFVCNEGYNLVGNPRVRCEQYLQWSTVPYCIRTSMATSRTTTWAPPDPQVCSRAPAVENAVPIRNYRMGTIPQPSDFVDYICNAGYYIIGESRVRCGADLQWTRLPYCEAEGVTTETALCPAAPVVANALAMPSFERGYPLPGDYVDYYCNEGYTMSGPSRITCESDLRWSATPYCEVAPTQPQTCGDAPTVVNAQSLRSYQIGASAVPDDYVDYTCNPGYALVGNFRVTCQSDLRWSTAPYCQVDVNRPIVPQVCPEEPAIDNAIAIRSFRRGQSAEPGDYIDYTCNFGYNLVGEPRVRCLSDLHWSALPYCRQQLTTTTEPLTCPEPMAVANAQMRRSYSIGAYARPGDYIDYTCNSGYTMLGDFRVRCGSDLRWNPVPYCQLERTTTTLPQVCPEITEVANALSLRSYRMGTYPEPGDYVDFFCNPGFTIIGESRVKCLSDLRWSPLPYCQMEQTTTTLPQVCAEAPKVLNAVAMRSYRSGTYARPGDYVDYVCNPGYTITGDSRIRCQQDLVWSALPYCREILTTTLQTTTTAERTCPQVPLVANAAQMPSYPASQMPKPGDYVDYVCGSGFTLIGLARVTCQSNLRWSAVPYCQLVQTCSQPPTVTNGRYMPSTPHQSLNSFKPGDSLTVSCHVGFELIGGGLMYCLASGEWSEPPLCLPGAQQLQCQDLPDIENAVQVTATFQRNANIGDYVKYQCQTGFMMVGNETSICQSDGSWTPFPKCVRACPDPPAVLHGRIKGASFNGRPPLPGDSVLVECINNYTLSGGVNYMLCRSDNTWTSPPTCSGSTRSNMCSLPIVVSNADIVQKSFSEGSQPRKGDFIVYQCRPGFTTEDSATIVCGDNGGWSRIPSCIRETTCPNLSDIPNGKLIDKTWSVKPRKGDTATFRCAEGSELRGNPLVVCKIDGTWSDLPSCEKVILCDMPPSVDHATITYRTFSAQPKRGDAITFDCLGGYDVIGFRTAYCKDDGTWSALPVCQKIGCGPTLPAPLNAIIANRTFTDTESKFGDYVAYACNPGFRAVTTTTVTCQSNGLWTQLPDCQPISCGVLPPLPANSRVVFKSFDNNAKINEFFDLACDSGFVLEGRAVVQCQTNGDWTEMPRCRKLTCNVPTPITRATATVTVAEGTVNEVVSNQLFAVGDRVQFACDDGYRLIGPSSISCLSTGEWSEMPRCQEVYCLEPPQVNNAFYNTSFEVFPAGSEVIYTCEPGYVFGKDSPTGVVCQNAKWSQPPFCEAGNCGPPPVIKNASVRYTSSETGGTATYTCRTGYEFANDQGGNLKCSENGTWVPLPPVCQPRSCNGQPNKVDFADLAVNGTTVGSYVIYTCQTGFKMIGAEKSYCRPDGTWGDAPVCLSVSCQMPVPIDNGRFTTTGLHVGDTTIYLCNDDYTMIGESTSICTSDLVWDQIPSCQYIVCSDIPEIPNGLVRYSRQPVVPGSVAFLKCLPGYEVIDSSERLICQRSSNWSEKPGRCVQAMICQKPTIDKGYAIPEDTTEFPLGAVIRYHCNTGYQLKNGTNALATCMASGAWSHEAVCIACPSVTDVTNGQVVGNGLKPLVGTSIDIICNPGYRPDQPHTTLTCGSNSQWSYPVPACIRVVCKKPDIANGILTRVISLPDPGNGNLLDIPSTESTAATYLPGTHVRLVCQTGYKSSGANSSVCLNTGEWSNALADCIRTTCSMPSKPANGRMVRLVDMSRSFTEPIKGESIRFSCEEGYHLNGPTEVRCLESGQWSEAFPTCLEVKCTMPPTVENGFVSATSGFTIGAAVSVSCNIGFRLVGDDSVRCLPDGTWDAFPTCTSVTCSSPIPVDNGRVVYDSSLVGGRAQYRCNRGFNLTGPAVITCQPTGQWSPSELPRCNEIICNQPPLIPNAVIAMHQDPPRVGAVATFICLDGFQITGPQMIVCTESGQWTNILPICTPVQCDQPPIVANASGELPTERHVGTRIVYTCVSGTTGFGDPTAVCQPNGTWSAPNFACKPSTCPEPPALTNGDITRLSGQSPGDYAEYQCHQGFKLTGSTIVTCLRDGSWSDAPLCSALRPGGCSAPPAIPNADVSYSSSETGALATYSCRSGYRAIGNPVVSCTSTGTWTEPPTCREVVCYGPPTVANADILRLTGYSFGSSATYRCKTRHQMVGEPTIVCNSNGAWSSAPSCVAADCVEPPQIANGVVEVQGFIVGSRSIYRCFSGFTITGQSDTITCQSSGRWSLPVPECVPDAVRRAALIVRRRRSSRRTHCSDPPPLVENALIIVTGPNIYYLCVNDTVPGTSTNSLLVKCLPNGNWSQAPTCLRRNVKKAPSNSLTCGMPPIPSNSIMIFSTYSMLSETSKPSDTIRFNCLQGFMMIGNDTITCGQSGVWSTPDFRCQRLSCGDPPSVDAPHAVIAYKSYHGHESSPNDYVIYSCESGYQLIGNSTIACQDISWSRFEFICQRLTCGDPPMIVPYAYVAWRSYDSPTASSASAPGDSARYECQDGFTLIGNDTIMCQNNVWGPPMFGCRKTRRCSQVPPTPDNAQLMFASFTAGTAANAGDYLVFTCRQDYQMRGQSNVTCLSENSWSPLPSCERERKSCGPAPIIQNAFIDQKSFTNAAEDGDSALYRCAAGFLVAGNAVVECRNGEWSIPPFCKPSQCSILPAVTNGTIIPSCSELICRAGEQVLVSCLPGFVLAGSPVITCVGDNSWSDIPVCLSAVSFGLTSPQPQQPWPFRTVTLMPPTVTLLPPRMRTRPQYLPTLASQVRPTTSTVAPDANCYVGPYIPAMVAQNEQSYRLSSSIHVFPDLMFTCGGLIRQWTFYCLSRYYERAEIYLDIWRPTQQFGTSRFDYQLIGSNLVRSMVYGYNQIEVGPGQQLAAQVGDVIGFHYNNMSISSRFLVIPMADEADPWPFVPSDLVRVLSNESLSHDGLMDLNGLISFSMAQNDATGMPRRQLPLIQAVVARPTGQSNIARARSAPLDRLPNHTRSNSGNRNSRRRHSYRSRGTRRTKRHRKVKLVAG